MADQFGLDIKNGPAFTACLDQIRKEVDDPAEPLGAAGRELVAAAAAAAPRRTGRLAGAHRLVPSGRRRVRVTVDTPYAAPVHWGWLAHDLRRQPWVVATWLRNPAPLAKASESLQAGIDKATART